MSKALDLTGQRFGRLVALEPTEKRQSRCVVWLCKCDCGKIHYATSGHLTREKGIKSCGCLVKELAKKHFTTHGMSKTLIYKIWKGMIQRCENPSNPAYKDYGGRGIKVCERWRNSFEAFYADVGDPPKGMTLDRWPDNDNDYEPTNWRWATWEEQANNRRSISCGPMKQRWFYGHGPNGEMIIENNQIHVARTFNLSFPNISACLHGRRQHHKNWTFQWIPKQQGDRI